jgi:hypothetical protein
MNETLDKLRTFFSKKCVHCGDKVSWLRNRLQFIILEEQSTTTRLFFGLATFFFGIFFLTARSLEFYSNEYTFMFSLAPAWLWGIGFMLNGSALIVGAVTNKYSKIQLFLEGVLGVVVWIGSAYAVVVTQRAVGAHVIAGLIAFWIYIRYPTHWEGIDKE